MKKRITQRDVAREAGVDVSTVSLSLNAHPRIPKATRNRVLAIAARLGYRPDPALASIAASRWSQRRGNSGVVLAFVVDDLASAEIELKHYLEGVRAQAQGLGYEVTPLSLTDYQDPRALLRVIRSRGIRGIIIGQSRKALPELLFEESHIPVVHCGYLKDVPGDVVRPDLRLAMLQIINQLTSHYNRVACVLPVEEGLHSDRVILGAALSASKMLPSGRLKIHLIPPEFEVMDLVNLQSTPPEAIIIINERQAERIDTFLGNAVPKIEIHTVHTLPPFKNKKGADLRLVDVGRASVNLLEIKLRHQPLSAEPFRQSLLVAPRLLSQPLTA